MKIILNFIVCHCLALFENYGFRFVDSAFDEAFGGDAYVDVESIHLKIRFVLDRSQLLINFASKKKRSSTWYSIDLISRLILGGAEESGVVDQHYAEFMENNMSMIISAFSDEKLEFTIETLNKFSKERAKRMFG